jgi:hypothetical protein
MSATAFPLQSVQRLFELDFSRCREKPFPLCGQLGLQSLTRPAGSVLFGSTLPLRACPFEPHLEVFPTGPGDDPRQKILSPLLTFRPT